MNPRILLRGLLLIGSLVALGYLFEVTQLGSLLDKGWIDSEIRGKGLDGELIFIAIGALATAVGLPRQLIGFLGGYAFGFLFGTLAALIAASLGCVIAFYYSRLFGRALVMARFERRIRRVNDFLSGHTFSMTVLIRLLPIGSNLATNLAAGVTHVPAFAFIAGSALGYIPQTAVFALAGSGIEVDPVLRIGLAIALFVISGVLGAYLYRRFRHGRSLDREIDRELGEEQAVEEQQKA
ncbi:SNARE associated Golgi protein [Solemya pervernicosa gill symbiont]|uniref:TVP38/TMEM64 family membrane protein n=2 Tax=Gammaproteobacteria incertae sedis TaxID=118884 RepID=A0A1T2L2Z7_9GAMM|nr:VTT domain-containing protein [Candidatus Reidiella endopervernicosa]OOZ39477.1 SNARE associated Golgi protein [Solemya pervernicosa gill symbiont]QKQ25900.1 TVP38/TMEM64 family protein [Candidatus Reidiella endopervernicosa]